MALSESIKKTCEKALDDEMQLYRSSKRIPTVKLKGLKSYCLCFMMVLGFEKFNLLCIVFFFLLSVTYKCNLMLQLQSCTSR